LDLSLVETPVFPGCLVPPSPLFTTWSFVPGVCEPVEGLVVAELFGEEYWFPPLIDLPDELGGRDWLVLGVADGRL
jgi:hypothetical protein